MGRRIRVESLDHRRKVSMAENSRTDSSPEWIHSRWLAALDRLILRRYGSYKQAEELTGARRITLRQWRQGKRRPSFQTLLQTLDQLGFDLLEVTREAQLYPQLASSPRRRLEAVLPRMQPRGAVLKKVFEDWSETEPSTAEAARIVEDFYRLELILDRDPRVARAELLEFLDTAEQADERCAALCLWAMWLNSQGSSIDAGLAVHRAMAWAAPDSPIFLLLLCQSAAVCKNLQALEVAKQQVEQSIFGFLRRGDLLNSARGLLRLGIICWALEDYRGADRAYLDAIDLCPDSRFAAMCRFNMVYNYLAQDQMDRALKAVEEGREQFAAIPPAYALRMHWLSAKVLIAVGRRRQAIDELEIALHRTDLEMENPLVVFQMFLELAEQLAQAGRSPELAPYGRKLLPLISTCDDSSTSVAVCRAFLHEISRLPASALSPAMVRAYALRFHQALESG